MPVIGKDFDGNKITFQMTFGEPSPRQAPTSATPTAGATEESVPQPESSDEPPSKAELASSEWVIVDNQAQLRVRREANAPTYLAMMRVGVHQIALPDGKTTTGSSINLFETVTAYDEQGNKYYPYVMTPQERYGEQGTPTADSEGQIDRRDFGVSPVVRGNVTYQPGRTVYLGGLSTKEDSYLVFDIPKSKKIVKATLNLTSDPKMAMTWAYTDGYSGEELAPGDKTAEPFAP